MVKHGKLVYKPANKAKGLQAASGDLLSAPFPVASTCQIASQHSARAPQPEHLKHQSSH